MRFFTRIPVAWRYRAVVLFSTGISLVGVFWAVHIHNPSEGGRGGLVATVVAIIAFLVRPDYGSRILDLITSKKSLDASALEQIETKVNAVIVSLRIQSHAQSIHALALVVAIVIGTIFWGFGDVLAGWLIVHGFMR